MPNGQLPEEGRDQAVEQLMQVMFPAALPTSANDVTPTLFVGCGGTGKGIVREIKQRIRKIFPDNPLYQFVVFDTDPRHAEDFSDNEFCYLGGFDPTRVIYPMAPPSIGSWWQPGFTPAGGIIDDGARTIRMLGRLALFHNIDKVNSTLSAAIGNALNYFQARFNIPQGGATIHAYVISSVSGGTGSGIYLDIAYLIQALCNTAGVRAFHLVGALGLPDVFENTLNLSSAERQAIEANSYAALEELDRFMSKPEFRCNYGSIRVNSSNPPFNMVYLFGAVNKIGLMLNKRETIFAMVGAALQLEAATNISQTHQASYAFTAGRWEQVKSNRAFYSSLAAASITFPTDLIIQYCALQLAERMLSQLQSSTGGGSTGHEAQAFVDANNLNEDGPGSNQVQDYLNRDEHGQKMAVVVDADDLIQRVTTQQNAGALMRRTIQDFENLFNEHKQVIHSRAEQLLSATKQSLAERVAKLACDPNYGPNYASQFLEDLKNLLQVYSEQMQQESRQLQVGLQGRVPPNVAQHMGGAVSREESWALMVEQAASSSRLFRAGRVRGVLRIVASDMNQYYAARLSIALLQESEALFISLIQEIDILLGNLNALMSNLRNIEAQIVAQRKAQELRIRSLKQEESNTLSVVDLAAAKRVYEQKTPPTLDPYLTDLLKSLGSTHNPSVKELTEQVLTVAVKPFVKLRTDGLETIAEHAYGNEWQQKLQQMVENLFSRALHPFWGYHAEYKTADDHRTSSYYAALPQGAKFLSNLVAQRPERPQLISIENPHTLLVLYLEHNVPLFPLTMLPRLYDSYSAYLHPLLIERRRIEAGTQLNAQCIPLHLHKDWHHFEDILPPEERAERLRTFAVAVAYGVIKFQHGRGAFLKVGGRGYKLGDDRTEAAKSFMSNSEWLAYAEEALRDHEGHAKPQQLVDQLKKALDLLEQRNKEISSTRRQPTPAETNEQEQIQQEQQALREYLARLQQDLQGEPVEVVRLSDRRRASTNRGTQKRARQSTRRQKEQ